MIPKAARSLVVKAVPLLKRGWVKRASPLRPTRNLGVAGMVIESKREMQENADCDKGVETVYTAEFNCYAADQALYF